MSKLEKIYYVVIIAVLIVLVVTMLYLLFGKKDSLEEAIAERKRENDINERYLNRLDELTPVDPAVEAQEIINEE